MNSYNNLKKLFKKDLVSFTKVDSKFVVRKKDKNLLVFEFMSIENYPLYMSQNINPYSIKFYNSSNNDLRCFNIDDLLINKLDLFMSLSIELNKLIKELTELKIFDKKPIHIPNYVYLYFGANYKEIETVTIFLLKYEDYDSFYSSRDLDKIVYNFKSNYFSINDEIIDDNDIELIIKNKKTEFKNKINNSLVVRANKIRDFINEY